jgi:hypothetical protein
MVSINKVSGDELRADPKLQNEIYVLARPSYEDPTAILEREFDECTTVYLGRENERLVCFYLTTWDALSINGTNHPAVHLGLSATRQDTKNSGLIGKLYARCISDALEWERRAKRRLLLWSTTASPTVFLAVSHFLADAEPHLDGGYSEFGASAADAIRKRLCCSGKAQNEHPFVLKGVATGTNYSEDERRRIAIVSRRKKFNLFERLGVDEQNRDRLIFLARTPANFERFQKE